MMNKLSPTAKITAITFIAAIFGLATELYPLFSNVNLGEGATKIIFYIRGYLETIHLSYFYNRLFEHYNFDSRISTNFLNLACYMLALTGGILYITSKQRESRLIRFFFTLVFFANILFIIFGIFSVVYILTQHLDTRYVESSWIIWPILFVNKAYNLLWVYLAYWVLKHINSTKAIDENTVLTDDIEPKPYKQATRWQRFFHLVMDTIICILLLAPLSQIIGLGGWLEKLSELTSERTVIYFLVFIFRLIYYPFWEGIFGATPAKFLTETRVVRTNGEKIGFSDALVRTLCRFIPFEPFSFFGSEGWHDSLSGTQVVCEKRTGAKGGLYFLIIPLFIGLGLGVYFGYEKYKDHKSYLYRKGEYDQKINEIEQRLKQLSTDDFIKITDADRSYSSEVTYLKVEKIKGDNILVSILPVENSYRFDLPKNTEYFLRNKEAYSQAVVKKSDLNKAYTKDYDDYEHYRKSSADLLGNGKKFEIESIVKLYEPVIKDRGTGSSGQKSISLAICNYGWGGNMVEIKNLEGSITWENSLPQRIEPASENESTFYLQGSFEKSREPYKFKLIVEDTLKRRHIYFIEGSGLKRTLKKVDQ